MAKKSSKRKLSKW